MRVPLHIQQAQKRFLGEGLEEDIKLLSSKNISFIVPLGKPGAGKGTQLQIINQKYDIQICSTGDIFRNPSQTKVFTSYDLESEDLAQLCKYYVIEQKKLLPDNLTVKAIVKYVSTRLDEGEFNPDQPIFMDTFPRTLGQYRYAQDFATIKAVLHYGVEDIIAIQRQKKRAKELNRPDNGQEYDRMKEYYATTHHLVTYLKGSNSVDFIGILANNPDPFIVFRNSESYLLNLDLQKK